LLRRQLRRAVKPHENEVKVVCWKIRVWRWELEGLRDNKWTKKERPIQSLRRFLLVWSDFLRRSRARKWSLSLVEGEEVGEWFNQDWDSFHLGSDGHKERNRGFISDSWRCFRITANYCDLLTFESVDYHSLFVSLFDSLPAVESGKSFIFSRFSECLGWMRSWSVVREMMEIYCSYFPGWQMVFRFEVSGEWSWDLE
jgi:hypothetical protein